MSSAVLDRICIYVCFLQEIPDHDILHAFEPEVSRDSIGEFQFFFLTLGASLLSSRLCYLKDLRKKHRCCHFEMMDNWEHVAILLDLIDPV